MATLQIELDDTTGQPKELPDALKKHVDTLIAQGVDKGFKARHAELRTQLEKELKASGGDPVVAEKLKTLEEENQRFKLDELERQKKYDEAEQLRKEREEKRQQDHQKELTAREQEIQRRDNRLRETARTEIKIAAKKLGARDESLDELGKLLGADLDLDADLNAFVKGADGKPAADKDGKPVTIEGHVKAYLDTHPHHRASTAGTGGGARGGANLEHLSGPVRAAQQKVNEATAELEKNPHSNVLVNRLLEAQRELRQAQAAR